MPSSCASWRKKDWILLKCMENTLISNRVRYTEKATFQDVAFSVYLIFLCKVLHSNHHKDITLRA
jgi:hypothetical protein